MDDPKGAPEQDRRFFNGLYTRDGLITDPVPSLALLPGAVEGAAAGPGEIPETAQVQPKVACRLDPSLQPPEPPVRISRTQVGCADGRQGSHAIVHAEMVDHAPRIQSSHAVGDDVDPGPSLKLMRYSHQIPSKFRGPSADTACPADPAVKDLKPIGLKGAPDLPKVMKPVFLFGIEQAQRKDNPVKWADTVGQDDGIG